MRLLITLLLTLLSVGCQLFPARPDTAVYQRGILVLRDDGYRFRACARQEWQPVTLLPAPVAQAYQRQYSGLAEMPLYVEAFMIQDAAGWQLLEPRLMGGGLEACAQHLTGVQLMGIGGAPDWAVRLKEHQLVLELPAQRRRLIFDEPQLIRRGQLWQWHSSLSLRGDRLDLLFEVEPLPCRDREGNWYALTARADLEGEVFNGCARYGDLQLLNLAARYDAPAGSGTQLTLLLRGDGGVRLVERTDKGAVLQARAGHWRLIGAQSLLLELEEPAPETSASLLWRRQRDGRLVLVGEHPGYGKGLMLNPGVTPLQWWGRGRLP